MDAIGKFVVVRKLGAGGMGIVYEARDPTLDRPVAVKLLNDRADPERFRREAKLAAKVEHPNCVPIYHADEHNGQFFVVMELVAGENAAQYLERCAPLPWQTATRLVIATGRGLTAVHDAGLIHRDLKPANILISNAGVVKLTDFGLARPVAKTGDSLTGDRVIGTPHFMCPEQCCNEPVDARGDIYSLGATYYVLLTGETPFRGGHDLQVMFAHCNDPAPDPRAARPDLPEVCAAIVRKAMAKSPAARHQSASELVGALEAALAADPNPPGGIGAPDIHLDLNATRVPSGPTIVEPRRQLPETTELNPARRNPSRRRLLFALPILAAAAAGTGGYFFWRNTRSGAPGGSGDANGNGSTPPVPIIVPERKVGGHASAVELSDDGRWLAVGLAATGQPRARSLLGIPLPDPPPVYGVKLFDRTLGDAPALWWNWRDSYCRGVAFSPDGTLLAAAGGVSQEVRLWNMTEQKGATLHDADCGGNVQSVAFSSDGKLLAAAVIAPDGHPSAVRVWDMTNRTRLHDLARLKHPIRDVAFASESGILAAALARPRVDMIPAVEVWDAAMGRLIHTFPSVQAVRGPAVACARKTPILAVADIDGVDFYDLPSCKVHSRRFSSAGVGEPSTIALSPDGTTAAISIVNEIVIWDLDPGVSQPLFQAHDDEITALAFSNDGKTLISGSDDRTVREWLLKT